MFMLTFLCVLMVSVRVGDGVNCAKEIFFQFFSSTEHSFTAVTSDFSVLVVNISESLIVRDQYLYYIMWHTDPVVPPYIDEEADSNTALEYITAYISGSEVDTLLTKSILGLVDYGHDGRMTDLDYYFYFEFNSTDLPNVCKLQISHQIVDVNTQNPKFEKPSYSVELREDFPLYFPIEQLQVKIYDYDASSQYNRIYFSNLNYDCPLRANQSYYEPQNGEMVTVPLYLASPLNYEGMASPYVYNCIWRVMDQHNYIDYSSVYLSVAPALDEMPRLSDVFYTGILMSVTVGSVVVVEPEIGAKDPDYPNVFNPTMVYSISGTDTDGGEKYFQMNSSTGIVTVKTEISQELLKMKEISFKFTACDDGSQCDLGFLTISLPYLKLLTTNNLQFEKRIYSVEVADPLNGDELLRVHVQTSDGNQQNVIYSFTGDSPGQLYFSVGERSGIISLITDNPPTNTYTLTVMASNGIINTTTEVDIRVSSMKNQLVFTTENFVNLTVSERFSSKTVIYTVKLEEAGAFCLLNVEPAHFQDYIEIDRITGDLIVYNELNIDGQYKPSGNVIHVRVGAYRDENTSCQQSYFSDIIYKNEVEMVIEVIDEDEYLPFFMGQQEVEAYAYEFCYPTVIQLQKILRIVATVKVLDNDFTQVASLSSDDLKYSEYYDLDFPTGAILQIGGSYVPGYSPFRVTVNDSYYTKSIRAVISPLALENIFTLRIKTTSLSHIEEKIMEISKEEYMDIYLLYFNVIEKDYSTNLWTIDAHVYTTGSFSYIISHWRETSLCESPREFTDIKYFDMGYSEDTDYKTAMIVLSTVLGCLCFGVFGFYFCISMKKWTGK